MKIKPGDFVYGTDPYTGQICKFKYLGKDKSFKGFTKILMERDGTISIVSDKWIKFYKIRATWKENG